MLRRGAGRPADRKEMKAVQGETPIIKANLVFRRCGCSSRELVTDVNSGSYACGGRLRRGAGRPADRKEMKEVHEETPIIKANSVFQSIG
jgi:hypothetical protein